MPPLPAFTDSPALSSDPRHTYPDYGRDLTPLLILKGVAKCFMPQRDLFRDLNLEVFAGQSCSLQGESGCGKSTLLNLVAGIEPASAGEIWVAGHPVHVLSDRQSALLRAREIGFVFQAFHLLPNLPVWRNIALPLFLNGLPLKTARERVRAALGQMNLLHLEDASPASLSGGEAQRVALLRALIHAPKLVLADEPTGNLDPDSAHDALHLLIQSVQSSKAALVMVTHSEQAAGVCARNLQLTGGKLIEKSPDQRPVASRQPGEHPV